MALANPQNSQLPYSDGASLSAWQVVIEHLPEHQRPAAWRALSRLSKSPEGEDGVFPQFLLLCAALSHYLKTIPERMIDATQKASQISPDIRLLRETAATQDQTIHRIESILGRLKILAWAAIGCFGMGLVCGLALAKHV
jgi:hypothetical protein